MTMTTDHLARALRACAAGLCPLEAGVALLASNGTFLHRDNFTGRFIQHGTSSGVLMAAIDWDAAIAALKAAACPAPPANAASSNSPLVSPEAFPPASETPSPASTTPTSADC